MSTVVALSEGRKPKSLNWLLETASVKSQHDSEGRKGAGIEETNPEIVAGKRRLLRHILELIADQSGFLMEEKLDELLRPYTLDEKTFVRLDNVFAVCLFLSVGKLIVD